MDKNLLQTVINKFASELFNAIENVFMSPAVEFGFLSSSIIKDIARHHGKLDKFVHVDVEKGLREKFK